MSHWERKVGEMVELLDPVPSCHLFTSLSQSSAAVQFVNILSSHIENQVKELQGDK